MLVPMSWSPLDEGQIEGAVCAARPFVIRRLLEAGCGSEVDSALQEVREVLWRRAAEFDPARGSLEAYAHGIARHVLQATVRVTVRQRVNIDMAGDEDTWAAPSNDPLESMVGAFTQRRLLEYIADTVSARDWEITTAFALDNSASPATVAAEFGVSDRQLRASRAWVRQVASTARAALEAADAGKRPDRALILTCLPDSDGLRTVAVFVPALQHAVSVVAAQTGLSEGRVRSRLPKARALLQLAGRILHEEGC
jgi:DNA-directed RNA polymerase specialized sigma24 family protein